MVEPVNCCAEQITSECHIIKKGYFRRSRIFDIHFPFYLEVPKYYCSIHNDNFNLITFIRMYKDKLPSLISIIDKTPISIIIFDKTILVK